MDEETGTGTDTDTCTDTGTCTIIILVGSYLSSLTSHRLFIAEKAPQSLRALYGTDGTQNACHGSDSEASAAREIGYWFAVGSPGSSAVTVRTLTARTSAAE